MLCAALLLMLPALWNGFPFIFFDSGDYLGVSLYGQRMVYRDPVYGFVIGPLHGHLSLWGVIIEQSLLTAWILLETSCQILPRHGREAIFLGIVCLLALGSSLPWFSGQIMPDLFGGLAVLLIFLLALGDMPIVRHWLLAALLSICLASHLTFLPMGICCLGVLVLLRAPLLRRGAVLRVTAILAAVSLAPILVIAANLALGGPPVLSQTGHAFLLARLVQDGLAKKALDRLCPDPGITLCAVKDNLPSSANDFLWGDSDAFQRIGGWLDSKPEANRIILSSLTLFPADHIASALRLSAQQLVSFATGDGLQPQAEPWGVIAAAFPADLVAYAAARQQTERLSLPAVNELHRPLAALSLCLLPILAVLGWHRHRRESAGLAVIGTALIANAILCAVLSNPVDRYQSRLIWLAVFAVGLAVPRLIKPRPL